MKNSKRIMHGDKTVKQASHYHSNTEWRPVLTLQIRERHKHSSLPQRQSRSWRQDQNQRRLCSSQTHCQYCYQCAPHILIVSTAISVLLTDSLSVLQSVCSSQTHCQYCNQCAPHCHRLIVSTAIRKP